MIGRFAAAALLMKAGGILFAARGTVGMGIRYWIVLGWSAVVLLCWLTLVLLALSRSSKKFKCPNCQSTRIRPSWPGLGDKILYCAFVRPYRCEACRKRFYALKGKRVETGDARLAKKAGMG